MDFTFHMYHDRLCNYPMHVTDYGTATTNSEVLELARDSARELNAHVIVHFGPGVVVRYDDGTFCGTEMDAAIAAWHITPGGRVYKLP